MRDTFGNPFRNDDSGIRIRDSENTRRMQKAWEAYWKTVEADPEQKQKFTNTFNQQYANLVRWAAPACGLIVGKFFTDAYCSPKFIYFRLFMVLAFTSFGFKYGQSYNDKLRYSFFARNFQLFPKEIQDMIRSSDHRYARKWLQN